MLRLSIVLGVLLAIIGSLALTQRPSPRADFVFINRGDVTTLDLQRMSWMQDLRVARLLYEGLVGNDVFSRDFKITPGVAESWAVSSDRRTYTFRLRSDAKWSNGDPVVADDFVFSWRRALLPDIASDYANFFWLIDGGREFFDWRVRALRAFNERPFPTEIPGGREFPELAQRYADAAWLFVEQAGIDPGVGVGRVSELRRSIDAILGAIDEDAGLTDRQRYELGELVRLIEPLLAELPDAIDAFGKPDEDGRTPGFDGVALWDLTLLRFDQLVELRAADDRTLEVGLVRPTPYWLDLCAFAVLYPVNPGVVSKHETPDPETGRLRRDMGWTKPGRIVTNGPFELTAWSFKREMRLRKSPYYWGADSIDVDTISMPSVEDANAQVLAFESGAVDWVSDVTPTYRGDMLEAKREFYAENAELIEQLRAQGLSPIAIDRALPPDKRKQIHAFPAFGTYFYNFNCKDQLPDGRDNPFKDAQVRRAFAMAIDRRRVAEDVRRIGEPVATTLIPPGALAGYESPEGLPFDIERARAELAEAGYPQGRGFPTVSLLFNKDGGHDLIAQAVARDWEEHLGVTVLLEQKEIKVFRDDLKNHNFMASRAGWYGDYGDPTTFTEINRTGDGNNDRAYSSERYDALLEQADRELDPDARLALLSQAERIIVEEDLPLIPIFHYSQVYLFDADRLSGINAHPRSQQNLQMVDVIGDGKGAEQPRSLPPKSGAGTRGVGAGRTGAGEGGDAAVAPDDAPGEVGGDE